VPRSPTRPCLGPARSHARRNGESGNGRTARGSATCGTGSAGSGGARSSGCASSRDSPRQRRKSTRRRTRKRRKRIGGRFSPLGGSLLRPVTGADSGGRRTVAWGGRRGACHQAVCNRGGGSRGGISARLKGACPRGGARACGGARAHGGGGRRRGGGRTHDVGGGLEEEKAALLLLEVRILLSRGHAPDRRGPDGLFPCSQGGANRAPVDGENPST
jgi:hypothetical protein